MQLCLRTKLGSKMAFPWRLQSGHDQTRARVWQSRASKALSEIFECDCVCVNCIPLKTRLQQNTINICANISSATLLLSLVKYAACCLLVNAIDGSTTYFCHLQSADNLLHVSHWSIVNYIKPKLWTASWLTCFIMF